ncbi:MAG: HAD family phosphatase [Calothrix sp. SM1_7_51]|nr:HAD family phosphatase [Calothrix sp. SM1_7_51]
MLKAKKAGYLMSIVTGRELDSLLSACPQIDIFDFVLTENGAVLYFPKTNMIELLASPPPIEFLHQLLRRGISFYQNRVMTSVHPRYEEKVQSLIYELELPLHLIYHQSTMFILPVGIDKGLGLGKVLPRFNITNHQVIACGDGANDLALLDYCGFRVAVANAIDVVKAKADWVATLNSGDGVAEFIDKHLLR